MIKRALLIKRDNGYVLDSLAWAYYQKGMLPEALEAMAKAIAKTPADDPVMREHYGDIYLKLSQKNKAREQWLSHSNSIQAMRNFEINSSRKGLEIQTLSSKAQVRGRRPRSEELPISSIFSVPPFRPYLLPACVPKKPEINLPRDSLRSHCSVTP